MTVYYDDEYGTYINYYLDDKPKWIPMFFGSEVDRLNNVSVPIKISNNYQKDYAFDRLEEANFKKQMDLHWFAKANRYITGLNTVELLYIYCFVQMSRMKIHKTKDISSYVFNPYVFPLLNIEHDLNRSNGHNDISFLDYWHSLSHTKRDQILTQRHKQFVSETDKKIQKQMKVRAMYRIRDEIDRLIEGSPPTTQKMIMYKRSQIKISENNLQNNIDTHSSSENRLIFSLLKLDPLTIDDDYSDFNKPKPEMLKGKKDVLDEYEIQPNTRVLFLGSFTKCLDFVVEKDLIYRITLLKTKKHICNETTPKRNTPTFWIRKITTNQVVSGKPNKRTTTNKRGGNNLKPNDYCGSPDAISDALVPVEFLTKKTTYNIPFMRLKYKRHAIHELFDYVPNVKSHRELWEPKYYPEFVSTETSSPVTFVNYNFLHSEFDTSDPKISLDDSWLGEMNEYIQSLDIIKLFALISYTLKGNHFVQRIGSENELIYPKYLLEKTTEPGLSNVFPLFFAILEELFYNSLNDDLDTKQLYTYQNQFVKHTNKNPSEDDTPPKSFLQQSVSWIFARTPPDLEKLMISFKNTDFVDLLDFWSTISQIERVRLYDVIQKNIMYFTPDLIHKATLRLHTTINNIIFNAPVTKKKMTLYRGDMGGWKRNDMNQSFIVSNFVSTSLSMKVAQNFMKDDRSSNKCCLYKISVEPGSKLLYLDGITQCNGELELLISSGTNFKITEAETLNIRTMHHEIEQNIMTLCRYSEFDQNAQNVNLFQVQMINRKTPIKNSKKGG
jgi:hypothetical protein